MVFGFFCKFMRMSQFNATLIMALSVTCFACIACLKDKTVHPSVASGECETIISYTSDVRPIIEASCKTGLGPGTGCHDAWIDDYDAIKAKIVGGTWQNEVFVERTMPQIPNEFDIDSLTEEAFQIMKCWVDQGYPNN